MRQQERTAARAAAAFALSAIGCAPFAIGNAAAQNTGGVFPPMVNEGTGNVEYRIGYRPGEDGADDRIAQRIHVQHAPNDDLLWRVVGQVAGPEGDQDFDFVQAELFWDLSEDTDRWRTGLRFDGRIRNGAAPEQINVNWTNQFALSERWSARAILLNSVQIGDRAADGVAFETRANLFYTTANGTVLGVESYNLHGSTDDLDVFGGRQQIGPFAFLPVAQDWTLFTGVLFGANDRSPDADYRFWVTRNF